MTAAPSRLDALAAAIPGRPDALRAACARVEDWDPLVGEAERNGLAGILWRELQAAKVAPPPSPARRLETFVALQRLRQPWLEKALAEALAALAGARIPCAPLKGPFLAERLYGEAALRPSVDLDLLVAADDLDGATAALGGAGWRDQGGPTARWLRRHHHHLVLLRTGAPDLELHFRAMEGFGGALRAEGLLRRAAPSRFRGQPARLLAPEDEALYLAVHAAGHGLARIMWLVDLKVLLAAHPGLDWEAVVERARACGLLRASAFAFAAAADLGATVPTAARTLSPWRHRTAIRAARSALVRPRPWSTAASLALNATLADGPLAAFRFLALHLARVTRRRAARALGRLAPEEWSA